MCYIRRICKGLPDTEGLGCCNTELSAAQDEEGVARRKVHTVVARWRGADSWAQVYCMRTGLERGDVSACLLAARISSTFVGMSKTIQDKRAERDESA